MDQKRFLTAIVLSMVILLGFKLLVPPAPPPPEATRTTPSEAVPPPRIDPAGQGTQPTADVPPPTEQRDVPRLRITAGRVQGSINLVGARLDDLVLRDYREEISPDSKQVRLLEPRSDPQPYYVQYGFSAEPGGVVVPDRNTATWTASAPELTQAAPVTLSWDNGAGQVFEIVLSIDDAFMFTVEQRVRNTGATPVKVMPWARIRREYTPATGGYFILHEGLVGFMANGLQEQKYDDAKKESAAHTDRNRADYGLARDMPSTGGWLGITDKYWLTALIPDQTVPIDGTYRHFTDRGGDQYQVDYRPLETPETAPGATSTTTSHVFAGAKEVGLLDRYQEELHLPHFDKAVDFGWFYPFTKWIFYALDWLFAITGNFGIAILIFTVFAKALFFPLANKSYKSMSKMKLLGPKITEVRERLKDDPAKMQSEIMGIYRTSGVNPASGCLPMIVQIPVFFSLYKVIFVTIEMRHAPFFGWIRDLSAVDPTNVFNLFGLLPFDPGQLTHFLHLGVWPLIMGVTMFLQQKLNPPPPDPVQARIFQFMPIIFTFMLASFPAGLVIYWSWNNLLTIVQQWTIMRRSRLTTALPVSS